MKHQWRLRRELVETPDALRRWDRAYQCLLRWGSSTPPELTSAATERFPNPQEGSNASCGLCESVDPAPSSGANH